MPRPPEPGRDRDRQRRAPPGLGRAREGGARPRSHAVFPSGRARRRQRHELARGGEHAPVSCARWRARSALPAGLLPLAGQVAAAARCRPLRGGAVYTDDKAPVEWLTDLSILEIRDREPAMTLISRRRAAARSRPCSTSAGSSAVRRGGPQYLEGHIPGAAFVDLETALAGPPGPGGRHPLPAADEFARGHAGRRRVGDRAGGRVRRRQSRWPRRGAWWLLRYFGHPRGRCFGWGFRGVAGRRARHRAGVRSRSSPGDFVPRPGGMPLLDAAGAAAVARAGVLFDARTPRAVPGRARADRPGRGPHPWGGERAGSPELLRTRWAGSWARRAPGAVRGGRGARRDVPVGAYCGSGVAASHEVLALELAGLPAARCTSGSWSDWIRDPARPDGHRRVNVATRPAERCPSRHPRRTRGICLHVGDADPAVVPRGRAEWQVMHGAGRAVLDDAHAVLRRERDRAELDLGRLGIGGAQRGALEHAGQHDPHLHQREARAQAAAGAAAERDPACRCRAGPRPGSARAGTRGRPGRGPRGGGSGGSRG